MVVPVVVMRRISVGVLVAMVGGAGLAARIAPACAEERNRSGNDGAKERQEDDRLIHAPP
jgi:hypothetical protein